MEEVRVRAAGGEYPVCVGGGLYESGLAEALRRLRPGKLVVVSHPSIYGLHGQRLRAALEPAAQACALAEPFLFPQGEEHKNMQTLEEGYAALLERGVTRQDVILAFGGGVVGDLAGFMAATYMRGIRYVQLPTTLMAMVDASIGGKVGVDLRGTKNAVGSFHHPQGVFCDTGVLATLAAREMRSGLAEVAKYGFLYDETLLRDLEAWGGGDGADGAGLAGMIARCAGHKARVVEADERDLGGRRAELNYGHTFGHALESASGLGVLRHGEAVAVGMLMAARLSGLMGLGGDELYGRHREVLMPLVEEAGVPGCVDAEAVDRGMRSDKKRGEGLRFVLLAGDGKPRLVSSVPRDLVTRAAAETLEELRGGGRWR